MRIKHATKEGGEAALVLLKLINATAEDFKSNKKDWLDFGQYVQDILAHVVGALPDANQPREDLKQNVERLRDTVDQIYHDIRELQSKSGLDRVWNLTKDPETIRGFRRNLEEALNLFQLQSTLIAGVDMVKILEGVDINQHLQRVINKLSNKIGQNLVLSMLPYAEGASWNPSFICLENTRVLLLERILHWATMLDTAETAEIFWLTGVAGAGKSAVAHTMAQLCSQKGLLASSFFFDHDVEGRNRPKKLFSTIARDLANLDAGISEKVSQAIEGDLSLPTAHISRQFDKLIVGPSTQYSGVKPMVIVIDALDEAYDLDLLKILCDEVPKLPKSFKFILTSRSEDDIQFYLSQKSHIQCENIDIHGLSNQMDIVLYTYFRLQGIAERKQLGADWPDPGLLNQFIKKADGLFIWVSTFCDYLQTSTNPDKLFKSLLSDQNPLFHSKMSHLYSCILSKCNWDEEDFVESYGLLMGTIIALKTPVTMSTLQNWYPSLPVSNTLAKIGSLLTGWTTQRDPIQIMHLSLRDFLVVQAGSHVNNMKFSITEKEHSQRLAYHCLVTMNQGLKLGIPGIGYISEVASGLCNIPDTTESDVPETLWYSCRFWIDHIITVQVADVDLTNALTEFLSLHLLSWVEFMISKRQFQKLDKVRKWIQQQTLPKKYKLMASISASFLAECLRTLSKNLFFISHRVEALQVIEETVELYRQHIVVEPRLFTSALAESLSQLSVYHAALHHFDQALQSIEEAVKLYRKLFEDNPMVFTAALAKSLNHLSKCQSKLGKWKESLQTIEEATLLHWRLVTLHRKLLADNPNEFKPDLARSLNNLSIRQSNLGQKEESLQTVDEAVRIYRQLATDNPTVFLPNLARSLSNLSNRQSDLGQLEESLRTIEEAVALRRKLVTDYPAPFKPDLAQSLKNLSIHLSDLGKQKESLQTIEEAVGLYRELTAAHPLSFKALLAKSLHYLSNCQSDSGKQTESLQTIKEAVRLHRELAANNPAAFRYSLADSLNNMSIHQLNLGQQEESLQTLEEAVGLYKQIVADHPILKPSLTRLLDTLFSRLSALDYHDKALQSSQEKLL